MHVLVLNCGSSSLKFQVIRTDHDRIARNQDVLEARGMFERLGSQSLITLWSDKAGTQKLAEPFRDHRSAVDHILEWIVSPETGIDGIRTLADIEVVGHRVVHGGERFTSSVVIDDTVLQGIEDCIELAPLHNPANLSGIRAVRMALGPGVPQVAVFDTAFHARMPETSYIYAIPYQFYRRYKVRRYGFHGTSHRYVAYRYRTLTEIPRERVRIITLHLGNGCSICAISGGRSRDTSMGLTPGEGLVMGTRSGDVDPAIVEYLVVKEGITLQAVDDILNRQSGLLGISGLTNDMRELLEERREHQDRRASLAIDVFCYRARKYIGAYVAALNGADAIVFTGGIGENAAAVRAQIMDGLDWLGLRLDLAKNEAMVNGAEGIISDPSSRAAVWVIPTNEELLIARDAYRAVAT
ncbi:MAG: acetate/propionate family kinase [Candidatus Polarisedimenticolia bacterium]